MQPKRHAQAQTKRRAPGHSARSRFVFFSLAPIFLIFFIFSFLPIGTSIVLSFYRYSPLDVSPTFIGFGNFTRALFTDRLFHQSVQNTAKFVLIAMPLNLLLALPIAVGLNYVKRSQAFFRTIYFLPSITSLVAITLVFSYLFNPQAGLVNNVLQMLGMRTYSWLGEPAYALYATIAVAVWHDVGYNTVVFLAGLQTIPESLYEAATIDGASPWQRFRHITLPLLSRTTLFVTVLTTISYLQVFVPMQLMTRGGPLNTTRSVVLHIYNEAFASFRMGYASAISVLLMVVLVLITVMQMRFLRTNWEY